MTRTLLVAALIALPLFASAAEPPQDLQLFLLAGQSNMAGRGTVTEEDQIPHPQIWMLNADDQWVPAIDPLHFDKPPMVGVGPGRAFALALAKAYPNIQIGLIPCAHGGSPIAAWHPGAFYEPTKGHPWDDAIRRTQVAMKSGTLRGILWHQGESDSKPELAPLYSDALIDLVKRFRTTFATPDLPFIAGQLGQFPTRPWTDDKHLVDHAHQQLPTHVENTAFVTSDGLAHKGDDVHFDRASAQELGRRYATAYLELSKTNP